MVEVPDHIPRHFQMLILVLADRYDVAVIEKNVGRHQNGVRDQPKVHLFGFRPRIFEGMGPLDEPEACHTAENPGQLGDLRHIGLPPEDGIFRVKTAGQPGRSDVIRVRSKGIRVSDSRQGMIVRNEIEGFHLAAHIDGGLDHAKIMAPVNQTRRLDARQGSSSFLSAHGAAL